MAKITYRQIIPADGWCAVFTILERNEADQGFYTEPLAVWVLCEERGIAYVAGLTAEDMADGVDTCSLPEFVCYARIDDVERNPECYSKRARLRAQLISADC